MRYETYADHSFECKYTGSQSFFLILNTAYCQLPSSHSTSHLMCVLVLCDCVRLKAITHIQTDRRIKAHTKRMSVNAEDLLCAFPKCFFHHHSLFSALANNQQKKYRALFIIVPRVVANVCAQRTHFSVVVFAWRYRQLGSYRFSFKKFTQPDVSYHWNSRFKFISSFLIHCPLSVNVYSLRTNLATTTTKGKRKKNTKKRKLILK